MEYQLLCYTRKPDETMYYGPRLAYSMHIALREGDGKYIPLNHNSGVLFARATENADGSLNPKSLKKPYIVRLADGSFEIHALRIEGDGQAEVNETELCFKSSDLVVYEEMSECDCTCTAQKPDEAGEAFDEALISGIVGCVPGNVISITEKEAQYLKNKLMTPEIVRLEVQDSVQVSGAEDIGNIQATAYYSDGTSLTRSVDWNVGEIDFTKKNIAQKITGTVKQKRFAFPLLINRADPCIASWNGKYYFIATNDADGNHTLYIREADSIEGLESAEDVLLLDSSTYEDIGNLLWAPEFHEINGRLYIFHAATPGEFFSEESHIMLLKDGGSPCNRDDWSRPRKIVKMDGSALCEAGKTISLDMTCFHWMGEYYVVWSQRQFLPKDLGAWLYIAKLNQERPWELASEPVLLSKPDYGWDNNHTFVDEGPFALVSGDKLFVTFSGAAVDESYVVSYLELINNDSLLDRNSWRKNNYPILSARSVDGEYGTGHNAYVIDEDGIVWNTYHARPGADGPRSTGIRRVHFDVDGCPMLDVTEDRDMTDELRKVETTIILAE